MQDSKYKKESGQDFEILNDGWMAAFDLDPVIYSQEEEEGHAVYLGQRKIDQVDQTPDLLSLVIDIGSTTITVSLVDNKHGLEIASKTGLNPQRVHGDDVITRTTFVIEEEDGLGQLQTLIVDQVEKLGLDLLEDQGYDSQDLYGIFIAANAIMNHIFLGISPVPLGRSPYKLQFKGKKILPFDQLGLKKFGQGGVVVLPNISAFVGGDLSAGMIATEIYQTDQTELLIDIGTNGEMILTHQGQMYSTSCAAGPALEGMGIACGVTAQPGAVEEADYQDGQLTLQNINQDPTIGICGSGILALIREFLKAGLINSRGNIVKIDQAEEKDHHFFHPDLKALWVDQDRGIYISQKDIRQIQMAKGAILTGVNCLLDFAGIASEDLDRVYIAGQFGSYLSPESLTRVGLLPLSFFDKIDYVGNSSKAGCFMVAMNRALFDKMDEMTRGIKHLPLSIVENFDLKLAKATLFPQV